MKEYPYWWDTQNPAPGTQNQEPGTHNQEPFPSRADVAIVGAGYTGLAAARHLARAGASVVVFERERVGFGASSRNGGQVVTGMKVDPATLVARFGERRARQLFDVSLDAITSLGSIRYVLPTHYLDAWDVLFFGRGPNADMLRGILLQVAYVDGAIDHVVVQAFGNFAFAAAAYGAGFVTEGAFADGDDEAEST